MNKHRNSVWTDDGLRLQAVVPDRKVRPPQPRSPQYPCGAESPNSEEDIVVALTWPRETGWRTH